MSIKRLRSLLVAGFLAATGAAQAEAEDLRALMDRALTNGDFATALPLAERLRGQAAREAGAASRASLDGLLSVGTLRFLDGDTAGARATFETLLGVDHGQSPEMLKHYRGHAAHGLALVYQAQRRPEAVDLFREALAYAEGVAPPSHINVQITRNNLANALVASGEIEEAITLLERARDLAQAEGGGAYEAVTLSNLAHAYVAGGRFTDAERQLALQQNALADGAARRDGAPGATALIFDDFSSGPPVDCSMFGGGTGPVNPDPTTGGDLAQCGPFGTRPTFGGWGDWGTGDGGPGSGSDPCPACPCPICGGSGGGTPDPDPDPDPCAGPDPDLDCLIDDVVWACDLCYMEDGDRLRQCGNIVLPPAPPPPSTGTPITMMSFTDPRPSDPFKRLRQASLTACINAAQIKLEQCLAAAATPQMDCDDAYDLEETLRDLRE